MDGWFELGLGSNQSQKPKIFLCPLSRKIILFDWYFSGQESWLLSNTSYENLVNLFISSDKIPLSTKAGMSQLGASLSSRGQDLLFEWGDFPVPEKLQKPWRYCVGYPFWISGLYFKKFFLMFAHLLIAETTRHKTLVKTTKFCRERGFREDFCSFEAWRLQIWKIKIRSGWGWVGDWTFLEIFKYTPEKYQLDNGKFHPWMKMYLLSTIRWFFPASHVIFRGCTLV